jgi:hypothetical protein
MKFRSRAFITFLLGLALCGTAAARRGINTDGWSSVINPTTNTFSWGGNGVSLDSSTPLPDGDGGMLPSGVSMSFAPGNTLGSYGVATVGAGYDMFNWFGGPPASDGEAATQEQVLLVVTSSNSFTVDFSYADAGCSGETASLQVNSLAFSVANPCSFGKLMTGCTSGGTLPSDQCQYLDSKFTFDVVNGKVQLVGSSPWAGTASAPEMDPSSAFAGLSMLLGGAACLTGRRRSTKGD